MTLGGPFLFSFALALILVPLCRSIALRFGFVATPRHDRWHKRPIALFGGVAIGLSLLSTVFVFLDLGQLGVLLVAVFAIALMGLADDIWSLKPATKLVIEIALASTFLFFGYRLNWLDSITLDAMLTMVWIVGLTNAFNLLDNMDGLCAGIAVIAGAVFMLAALPVTTGSPEFHQLRFLSGLLGAVAAFLVYNVFPARIFMGDSGSLLIGMSLAGLSLMLGPGITGRERLMSVVSVPVLVLLIPIFDTTLVTASRMLSGRPTSVGGRDHSSHRLVAIGLSERDAVFLLWALAAVGGLIGLGFQRSESWTAIIAAVFFLAMIFFAVYLGTVRVYDDPDPRELTARPLTPIVVDLVYKRRVAEVVLDSVLISLCYYSAYHLKFEGVEFLANFQYFLKSLPVVLAAQLLSFFAVGVYRGVWRHFSAPDALTVVKGTAIGTAGAMFVILYLYRFLSYSRAVFVIDAALLTLMVIASRVSFRLIGESLQQRRQNGRRVIIYGAGDGGALAVRELVKHEQHSLRIIGFIDDDVRKKRLRVQGYPVLGTFDALSALILAGAVDAVVLSVRVIDAARLRALEALCTEHNIPLSRLLVGLESLVGAIDDLSTGDVANEIKKTGS